eukprot:COSAG03_NODE_19387_length_337_cov_1.306723_1_plen_53_part_10
MYEQEQVSRASIERGSKSLDLPHHAFQTLAHHRSEGYEWPSPSRKSGAWAAAR